MVFLGERLGSRFISIIDFHFISQLAWKLHLKFWNTEIEWRNWDNNNVWYLLICFKVVFSNIHYSLGFLFSIFCFLLFVMHCSCEFRLYEIILLLSLYNLFLLLIHVRTYIHISVHCTLLYRFYLHEINHKLLSMNLWWKQHFLLQFFNYINNRHNTDIHSIGYV